MTRIALLVLLAACAADPGPDLEPDLAAQPSAVNSSAPIVSAIGNKCLDNKHNTTADHNPIQLFTCNGGDAQKWLYTAGQFVSPGGSCLDITSNQQVAGTHLQLFHCNSTAAQQWTVRGKAIVSTSGLCLAVTGGSSTDGTLIELAKCDSSASQTWTAQGIAATGQVPTALTWDFAHEVILAANSDLWPTTWSADDTVATGWGDGGGFGQVGTDNDVSLGFAKISGTPPSIMPVNEWGSTSAGAAKAVHQATFCGKPESMMSAGGVLYAWIGSAYHDKTTDNPRCPATPTTPNHRLARSTDGGASWALQSLIVTEAPSAFVFNNFIEYGKDNAGAPGGFVYALGKLLTKAAADGSFDTAPGNYLVRIPQGSIGTLSMYQVFTGLDASGNAQWTKSYDTSHAARVDGTIGELGNVFFHAATSHYISAGFTPGPGSYVLYQAPQPWGPWTKFATGANTTAFGNDANAEALSMTFPTRWVSSDGRTIWAVYSWGDHAGDAFHLLKGTLTYNTDGK